MSDERESSPYLWDRTPSGEPAEDAQLADWEARLGRYRRVSPGAPMPQRPRRGWARAAALAACLLLAGALGWRELQPRPATRWSTWTSKGQRLALDREYRLAGGESVQVASIGRLRFPTQARFRILESGSQEVMELREGSFDALILADPYRFRVVTPGARLDDLGCAYEVSVDPGGAGRVAVSLGWVRAHGAGADSFVAQGYEASFRPGEPPSAPKKIGASQAEANDVLATLHQLWRGKSEEERRQAYRRLASLYPPPANASEERAAKGDRGLVKEWWPSLPLGKPIAFPAEF